MIITRIPDRSKLAALALLPVLVLSGCSSDGNFSILGYTTCPNYDKSIGSVRVPIFLNQTIRPGIEFELTKAVIREIEAKTPYKVINGDGPADTELRGTIKIANKSVMLRTPVNEIRTGEMVMVVELQWQDLRTGDYLTRPRVGPGALPPDAPLVSGAAPPPPVIVTSTADFIPELGQSYTSAYQTGVNRLATQIVSMMESPWTVPCK